MELLSAVIEQLKKVFIASVDFTVLNVCSKMLLSLVFFKVSFVYISVHQCYQTVS